MFHRPELRFTLWALTVVSAAILLPLEMRAGNKNGKTYQKPIRNPKFDPTAEQVDLFEAVEVTVRLIPKDEMGGNVLIENKTNKSLTVKVPEAVAGVSIHAQFGGGVGGGGLGAGGVGGGGGGQQGLGGGLGGGGGGLGGGGIGGGGGGGGFFSVPAEKVISVPFHSVCLEHGKPAPTPGSKYTLVPLSKLDDNPVLYKLLAYVGTGKVDSLSAQAAAWHLTNKMSFQELADKTDIPLPGMPATPYFSPEQLQSAQELVVRATQLAKEEEAMSVRNDSGLLMQTRGRSSEMGITRQTMVRKMVEGKQKGLKDESQAKK